MATRARVSSQFRLDVATVLYGWYRAWRTPQTLGQFLEDPDMVEALLYPDNDSEPLNSMNLGKAWQGLHYLLTGDPVGGEPPLSLAILDGTEIGPDLDYGPARYLTPDEVKTVAQALAALAPETLAQRYDPDAVEEKNIYPAIWAEEGAEGLEYLLSYYSALQRFYTDAAARGDVVIHWLA
ncbi:YfbM family protein [Massilia pinisoli]|uniref:YfbM family protein n=2 Tax=Massilia pinisoli TaxID=1772194 RepID=A0ABT1ZQI9_9BURK|nr:YfbM family protein [Massilia pinisoli]